jgi:hypothetical protein
MTTNPVETTVIELYLAIMWVEPLCRLIPHSTGSPASWYLREQKICVDRLHDSDHPKGSAVWATKLSTWGIRMTLESKVAFRRSLCELVQGSANQYAYCKEPIPGVFSEHQHGVISQHQNRYSLVSKDHALNDVHKYSIYPNISLVVLLCLYYEYIMRKNQVSPLKTSDWVHTLYNAKI